MADLRPRSVKALLLLAGFRFLTRRQLCEMLFGPAEQILPTSRPVICRRLIAHLSQLGLIASTRRVIGGPGGGSSALIHSLTSAGLHVAGQFDPALLGRGRPTGGSFLLEHSLVAADVALAFRWAGRSHLGHDLLEWEADWQVGQRLAGSRVRPDARLVYLTPTEELEALVEVDLGTEGSLSWQRKVSGYLDLYRLGRWPGLTGWPVVLTVAPTRRRVELLTRATSDLIARQPDAARLLAGTEFTFAALPDLLASGPLAPIWQVAGRAGRSGLFPGDPPSDPEGYRSG